MLESDFIDSGCFTPAILTSCEFRTCTKKGGIVKGCSSEIFLNGYGKMRENAQLQWQETELRFCVQEIETPWCHLLYATISFHIEINMKNQTAAVLP